MHFREPKALEVWARLRERGCAHLSWPDKAAGHAYQVVHRGSRFAPIVHSSKGIGFYEDAIEARLLQPVAYAGQQLGTHDGLAIPNRQRGNSMGRHFRAIPACLFAAIEGVISGAKERFRTRIFSEIGNSQRQSHRDETCRCGDWNGDYAVPQPFRQTHCRAAVITRRDHQELLAPIPAQGIIGSQNGLHPAGHLLKHGVAGLVTPIVVDCFEMVEVHHNQT